MKLTITFLCCALAAFVVTANARATPRHFAAASDAPGPKTYEGLEYLGRGPTAILDGSVHPITSDYYVSPEKLNWQQADESCIRLTRGEGSLVGIETLEEDDHLHNLIMSSEVAKIGQNLWTSGFYDTVKGEWIWAATGEPFEDTNWEGGQPPRFPGPLARVAFQSVDVRNHHWRSRPDHMEHNYYICEVVTYRNDTPIPCRKENDLVIVLDGSGSISAPDFVLGKNFSALLAGAFGPPSRIGYIVYASASQVIFGLSSGFNPAQIDAAIKGAVQPGGGTNTHLAIDDAIAQLVDRGIPRKMVVLTDGVSNDKTLTAAAAARANAGGIATFSVGIGSGINHEELLAIAGGDPANVFTIDNFDDLIQLIAPVCVRVCEV